MIHQVEESEDVHVVAGERPEQETDEETELALAGELKLVLGEDVRLLMDLAELDVMDELDELLQD